MLATRWRLLLSKLSFSLSTIRDTSNASAGLIENRQPAFANSAAMSAARRRYQLQLHARLRRTGHRG